MFIFQGKSYDNIYLNEDSATVVLSRKLDGVIYEIELTEPEELEQVTLTNDLSIEGLDRMYKELDMYEELIHELYKLVKDMV